MDQDVSQKEVIILWGRGGRRGGLVREDRVLELGSEGENARGRVGDLLTIWLTGLCGGGNTQLFLIISRRFVRLACYSSIRSGIVCYRNYYQFVSFCFSDCRVSFRPSRAGEFGRWLWGQAETCYPRMGGLAWILTGFLSARDLVPLDYGYVPVLRLTVVPLFSLLSVKRLQS